MSRSSTSRGTVQSIISSSSPARSKAASPSSGSSSSGSSSSGSSSSGSSSSGSSSSSSTPSRSSERLRRYARLVVGPKPRAKSSRSASKSASGSKKASKSASGAKRGSAGRSSKGSASKPTRAFSKLPHNRELLAAGMRSGQKLRVGDKRYVVERRALGKANILAVRRVEAEGAKPKRSRRVPPMRKSDKPGTRRAFRGREFELVQGAKMRRWKQIGGPPMTPRAAVAAAAPAKKKQQQEQQAAKSRRSSTRGSSSSSSTKPSRRSASTKRGSAGRRSASVGSRLERRMGLSSRSPIIIPGWHKQMRPMASPLRSQGSRSASSRPRSSSSSRGPQDSQVVALDADCFSFVIKPRCRRELCAPLPK
jgi:hypothetical protein